MFHRNKLFQTYETTVIRLAVEALYYTAYQNIQKFIAYQNIQRPVARAPL